MECQTEYFVRYNERATGWSEHERVVKGVRRIIVGLQLPSHHHNNSLRNKTEFRVFLKYYLVVVDADDRLGVDSRHLVSYFREGQRSKFLQNRRFSLKLSSLKGEATLYELKLIIFDRVTELPAQCRRQREPRSLIDPSKTRDSRIRRKPFPSA